MKARIVHAARETNQGKLLALDALQVVYRDHVAACVAKLIADRKTSMALGERKDYFPPNAKLSSQILKNAGRHAIAVMSAWVAGLYGRKLKQWIFADETLSGEQKAELFCIGKNGFTKPGRYGEATISKEMVDLYWSWVWDPEIAGNPPSIRDDFPVQMSEMTCVYGPAEQPGHFAWWLRFSGLEGGSRIQIPLTANPRMGPIDGLAKTVLVQKRNGRWRFQFCEDSEEPAVEDLDLKGCKGQKRFVYRGLLNVLSKKAPVEVVNPAYSSQMCPSCGHVARNNRKGIHFRCQNCGRTSHADAVGAINLRGRSDDQEIAGCENPTQLRALLEARYLKSRSSARGRSVPNTAPIPFGWGLTTGSPGTAPNPRMS